MTRDDAEAHEVLRPLQSELRAFVADHIEAGDAIDEVVVLLIEPDAPPAPPSARSAVGAASTGPTPPDAAPAAGRRDEKGRRIGRWTPLAGDRSRGVMFLAAQGHGDAARLLATPPPPGHVWVLVPVRGGTRVVAFSYVAGFPGGAA